jgi:hypothetical protein
MKSLLKKIIVLAALQTLASCAYALNGKNVDVSIDSNPQGADIVIEGRSYGRTPATIMLEPKNYIVTLTKEGYGSAQLQLESWQSIRRKDGEGGRCIADAIGTMLILPALSYWSVYCRDFKEPQYFVNIPYLGGGVMPTMQTQQPYGMPQYQQYYQQ